MPITETETSTLDTVPGAIEEALRNEGIDIPTIRFAARTDVEPDGSFGDNWFVLTETDVLALDATGNILHRVPYKEVTGIRSEAVVDGGILVLEKEADALDFLRYSNGLAPKFGYIAQFLSEEIEHLQGKREEAPVWDYKEEKKFCQTCGLPLRDEFSPCPACTKKHRVLLRILGYLKPYKAATALLILFVLGTTVLFYLCLPTFSRILVDDVLELNDAARVVGEVSETRLGQMFREIQIASIALAVAVGCLLVVYIITMLTDVFLGRLSAWLTLRLTADYPSPSL